jgi:hypothetical protein
MPEAGLQPLLALTALTFLRLKHRLRSAAAPPRPSLGCIAAAQVSFHAISVHYAFRCATPPATSSVGVAARDCVRCLVAAAVTSTTLLAVAAAPPLLVAAGQALWALSSPSATPPAATAAPPLIAPLAAMTQLECLEMKGSTAVAQEEWTHVLKPLERLQRLDVRCTTFKDGTALRGKPNLRVVLVGASRVASEASLRRQGDLSGDVRIRL